MWPKDYLNMCHIFYYNFSVNFLHSTWIRPQKFFQTNVGQPGLSALSQWHDTIHLQKKGSEGVFVECYGDKALSTNYLT